jgi:XTP/dITP diphosphohydrolase
VSPDWVVATGNPGKLREFRQVLRELPVVLHPLSDFPAVELPDEGDDYEANAVAKARTAARATGRPALADDSGLEVEALEGRPGPHSARYGGEGLDDAGRVSLLRGECDGRILPAPRGLDGFGYDPVFLPEGEAVSAAELEPERKNALSHRGRALRTLLARISDQAG